MPLWRECSNIRYSPYLETYSLSLKRLTQCWVPCSSKGIWSQGSSKVVLLAFNLQIIYLNVGLINVQMFVAEEILKADSVEVRG